MTSYRHQAVYTVFVLFPTYPHFYTFILALEEIVNINIVLSSGQE